MKYVWALALLSMALSGCGLWQKESEFDKSIEERPLEIPPDLDAPRQDQTMSIPGSSTANPQAAQTVNSSASMVLADSRDSAWRRVGVALERAGVEVEGRDPDTWTYVVGYVDQEAREKRPGIFKRWILRRKGPEDLSGDYDLKLLEDGSGTRIELRDQRGRAARERVSEAILGALRSRLG